MLQNTPIKRHFSSSTTWLCWIHMGKVGEIIWLFPLIYSFLEQWVGSLPSSKGDHQEKHRETLQNKYWFETSNVFDALQCMAVILLIDTPVSYLGPAGAFSHSLLSSFAMTARLWWLACFDKMFPVSGKTFVWQDVSGLDPRISHFSKATWLLFIFSEK